MKWLVSKMFKTLAVVVLLTVSAIVAATEDDQQLGPALRGSLNSEDTLSNYVLNILHYYEEHTEKKTKEVDDYVEQAMERANVMEEVIAKVATTADHAKKTLTNLAFKDAKNQECIVGNRHMLPSTAYIMAIFKDCKRAFSTQLNFLISPLRATVNRMAPNLNNLNKELQTCKTNDANTTDNAADCVDAIISAADTSFASNEKALENEKDKYDCAIKIYFKIFVDCSFKLVFNTINNITETKSLIKTCVKGDKCPEYNNKTKIANPYYGTANGTDF